MDTAAHAHNVYAHAQKHSFSCRLIDTGVDFPHNNFSFCFSLFQVKRIEDRGEELQDLLCAHGRWLKPG